MADLCSDTLALFYGEQPSPNHTTSLTKTSYQLANFTRLESPHHVEQNQSENDSTGYATDPTVEAMRFYLANVVNPFICIFGMIGNVFNVLVLSRRHMKVAMDSPMERGAHAGLIALAVSDELYCICALLDSIISRHHSVFRPHYFSFYVRAYGKYFQNTFARTGTWLTVIMAAGRYAAICRPIQARYLLGANRTGVAVVFTFAFWTLIGLPMIWTYRGEEIDCGEHGVFVIINHGPFVEAFDGMFKVSCTYVWTIIGFLLPVLSLVYFNFHLIRALRESSRMRSLYRVNPRLASAGSHVTPTLVAIVCLLLVLVTPSELLQFYYYGIRYDKAESFTLAIVVTNVLQTINFSINFVLYCIVNVHFRETSKRLVYCCLCRVARRPKDSAVWADNNSLSPRLRCSMRNTIETAI